MKLTAPPKLNRFLAVLGRREDGFHALELVTTVLGERADCCDTLEAEKASALELVLEGPTSVGLTPTPDNLVMRAWRSLERECGRPLPARLRLHKAIPHGAGLGGGSSDAATALRLGNAFFELNLPMDALLRLGAELGSDVPLFLLGGTVLGLDRGERVVPLRPIPLEPILLAHPGLHVPTPQVFKALATVGYPPVTPLPSLGEGATPPWRNDLTEAALHVCPALAEVRAALARTGGEPLLCGSGSCWAARYHSAEARDRAQQSMSEISPAWSLWAW